MFRNPVSSKNLGADLSMLRLICEIYYLLQLIRGTTLPQTDSIAERNRETRVKNPLNLELVLYWTTRNLRLYQH